MPILILLLRVLAVVLVAVSAKWNPPTVHLGFAGIALWMATDLIDGTVHV